MTLIRDLVGLSAVACMLIGGMFAISAAQDSARAYKGSSAPAVGYHRSAGAR